MRLFKRDKEAQNIISFLVVCTVCTSTSYKFVFYILEGTQELKKRTGGFGTQQKTYASHVNKGAEN